MKTISAYDATHLCDHPPSKILASMGILTQVDQNDGDRRWKALLALLGVILSLKRHEIVVGCSCVVVSKGTLERTYVICETSTSDGTPALGVLPWIEWAAAQGEVAFEVINDVPRFGAMA